jgi:hypothetical protein
VWREGKIEGRELLERRRGTNASLYLGRGFGLADEASSDAIPDTVGGGTAKPHGVIHRYRENHSVARSRQVRICIGWEATVSFLSYLWDNE